MKYGRRAPKNAPAILFSSIFSGQVPAHPVSQDNLAGLSGWRMLLNDTYGDCVAVTWANQRRLVTAKAGAEVYPDEQQVIELYRTQNPGFPGQDDGMDVQTCLEHLHKVGGPDGVKAVAFAKVNVHDQAEVSAAKAIFGDLWTGITVQQHNQAEFKAGQPWTYDPNDQVDGGHSVEEGGYTPQSSQFITWASEASWDEGFDRNQVEERWVVIWPEHLGRAEFQTGIDMQQLAADYQALTGEVLPMPDPNPNPAPGPVPVPPQPTPEPPAPPVPAPPAPEPTPAPPTPEPTPEPPSPVDPVAAFIEAVEDWAEGLFTRQAAHPREVALFDAISAYLQSIGASFEVRP